MKKQTGSSTVTQQSSTIFFSSGEKKSQKSKVYINKNGDITREGETKNKRVASSMPDPDPGHGGSNTIMDDDDNNHNQKRKCCIIF